MSDYFFLTSYGWRNKINKLLPYLQDPQKPLVILISGAACLGKSSVTTELCHLLGIRNNVSTDTIRKVLAINEKDKPLLSYFSHECWKHFNEYSEENLIHGLHKQSEFVCDAIDVLLKDASRNKLNTIIEGIHLLPSIILQKYRKLDDINFAFIYITADFEFFRNVLLPNRSVSTYRNLSLTEYDDERLSRFKTFRKMWEDEFKQCNISPIINNSSPEDLLGKILNCLVEQLEM